MPVPLSKYTCACRNNIYIYKKYTYNYLSGYVSPDPTISFQEHIFLQSRFNTSVNFFPSFFFFFAFS